VITWLGSAGFLLYNSLMFVFATPANPAVPALPGDAGAGGLVGRGAATAGRRGRIRRAVLTADTCGPAPRRALPWEARPAHAGPARADTRRSISSSPTHRRMRCTRMPRGFPAAPRHGVPGRQQMRGPRSVLPLQLRCPSR
jgi:hypothetical protein